MVEVAELWFERHSSPLLVDLQHSPLNLQLQVLVMHLNHRIPSTFPAGCRLDFGLRQGDPRGLPVLLDHPAAVNAHFFGDRHRDERPQGPFALDSLDGLDHHDRRDRRAFRRLFDLCHHSPKLRHIRNGCGIFMKSRMLHWLASVSRFASPFVN